MSDKPTSFKRTRNTAEGSDDEAEQHIAAKKGIVKNIWARNQSDAVELNFNWTIENFSLLSQRIDEVICSPEFSSGRDMHRWRLKLYPKGQHSCQGYIAVYLARDATLKKLPTALPTMFEITLLNSKQQVLTSNRFYSKMFDNNNKSFGKGLLKIEDVFSKSGLLYPTDELVIRCQVRYETKMTVFTGSTVVPQSDSAAASLSKRLAVLFNDPTTFSDLEIQVRGVAFAAHKNILAAGSPVFSAMLQAEGFTEQKTNILKIDDLEPPVVKEMLRFLYTDRVEKMDEFAKDLLMAADKYMIDLLKTQCQAALTQTITVENCCQLLALADSHSASYLKTVATSFVMQHRAEVSTTVGWNDMVKTHPHLGFQLFLANLPVTVTQPAVIKRELDKRPVSASSSRIGP